MENLLDNLNLLSPKNSQVGGGVVVQGPGSSQKCPSSLIQASPGVGYASYSSPSMPPQQQDYRKCLYGQTTHSSMSPLSMQSLGDRKPSLGAASLGQYRCPAGLLEELLTSEPQEGVVPGVSPSSAGHALSPYSSSQHGGEGRSPSQALPTSITSMNCLMSLSSLSRRAGGDSAGHLGGASPMQVSYALTSHLGAGEVPSGFWPISTNGFVLPPAPHHLQHHQLQTEKLPSDLDDMSIETFDCDMESVLHDTLMDGDSLDFNFEPMVTSQGFMTHSVKPTTHSWVSG